MGLFTKWYKCTCICCGGQFESYKAKERGVCPNCLKSKGWEGYAELRDCIDDKLPGFSLDEWNAIDARREAILAPYRVGYGVTVEELEDAGINFRNYTDVQCNQFIDRLLNSLIPASLGGIFTKGFIMPSAYPGVVVHPNDVFAIAIGSPYWREKPDGDVISIGFFTNDPAAPMFAVGAVFEIKGLSSKNKKEREALKEELTRICPNLVYPIMEYKELKNTIKKEKIVKGNISAEIILKYIERIDTNTSPFRMSSVFDSYSNGKLLNQYGYVYSDQLTRYLMEDKKSRKFWGDKLKLSSNAGAQALAATFNVGKFLFNAVRFMARF